MRGFWIKGFKRFLFTSKNVFFLSSGFQRSHSRNPKLNEISQGLRQALILSNNNSQITEVFWMLVAWILAGLASLLWIVLSIAKFIRSGGGSGASSNLSAQSGSQTPRRPTLDNITTNPEVWRKRLRSYFETKHKVTGETASS